MLIRRLLFAFTLLASLTFADVEFTSPASGATVEAGKTISVKWKDSGDDPPLKTFTTYQLLLCAGGNDQDSYIQVASIAQNALFSSGDSASGTIQTGIGGPDKNAYFLKIISAAPGGTVINYSSRFTLTGMTGTFPPNVQAGIKQIKGTDGPATENNVANNPDTGNGAGAGDGQFGQAYSMQTGITRYAPMQKKPPKKITAKSASPQYPTSSYKIAKTALPTPKQVTTITQSVTYSVSSIENTATPLSGPQAAMQKFLNRWRD